MHEGVIKVSILIEVILTLTCIEQNSKIAQFSVRNQIYSKPVRPQVCGGINKNT